MADFEEQVEGLTGLAITDSSDPTQDELTQYLKDGVRDVINRFSKHRPDELPKFCTTSSIEDSDTFVNIEGQILDVVRHHTSATKLRPCTPMAAALRYEATDTSSLHYRSAFNPSFYILDGKLLMILIYYIRI